MPHITTFLVNELAWEAQKTQKMLSRIPNDKSELEKPWAIRNGESLLTKGTKGEILRRMCFNHIVHHRAQLGVYLRLLDVPIPATYGHSADEQGF